MFFENIILKVGTKKLQTFEKNEIYVIILLVYYRHAKSELENYFWQSYDKKKLLKIDDVKNSNSIFVVIDQVEQNLDHHWIPRDKLHRIDTLCININ